METQQDETHVWLEAMNLTDALLSQVPEIKNQLKLLNKVVYV